MTPGSSKKLANKCHPTGSLRDLGDLEEDLERDLDSNDKPFCRGVCGFCKFGCGKIGEPRELRFMNFMFKLYKLNLINFAADVAGETCFYSIFTYFF